MPKTAAPALRRRTGERACEFILPGNQKALADPSGALWGRPGMESTRSWPRGPGSSGA